MAEKSKRDDFKLEIPLDASGIEGFNPSDQQVKVLVQDRGRSFEAKSVALDDKGQGVASFTFPQNPGALRVIVGPANATDEELQGLQTIRRDVSARELLEPQALRLPPIRIHPYYWHWWLRWCQTFTIRGRVVCPDGSPVPGAKVCAYDVDQWFFWWNTQLVGCNTTDVNGAFEITFRWCCGWWPWWWWRYRAWQINPLLNDRIRDLLDRNPNVRLSPLAGNQPSLAVFNNLLADEGVVTRKPLDPSRINQLDGIREVLLRKLPVSPELERLHIWPWWPWHPWWDCTPDIIFKVTQDCLTPGAVIYEENVGDTRWGISNPLQVTLIANQSACCRPECPPGVDCPDGECVVITEICGNPIDEIGGNPGAPAAPAGYLYPGAVAPGTSDANGDRPFGGVIPVEKNFGDMLNVDYYEIEHFNGVSWVALPPGAAVDFKRRWLETLGFTTGDVSFPFTFISGHNVVESREHFEVNGGLGGWNATRFWLTNRDLVVPLDTSAFTDGTYEFRVVGWQLVAGNLVNPKVLPICGTEIDNKLLLTFDNRILNPATHDASHNCGLGVHTCTEEPDTHFLAVRVNGRVVGPCETVNDREGTLEVEFLAHDPDGHLASYSLIATYGLNLAVNLLNRPGAVLTALNPGTQVGPTYGEAIALVQGATAPHWNGGKFRLSVPLNEAFPEPCCYQLELRAWKRTVVGYQQGIAFFCHHGYAHDNLSEYTIGVGVCP